jgi:hypothetical protein
LTLKATQRREGGRELGECGEEADEKLFGGRGSSIGDLPMCWLAFEIFQHLISTM